VLEGIIGKFSSIIGASLSSSARAIIAWRHENMKKQSNEARINEVEHGLFTPLIFSATGGMTNEAYSFYKHLTSLLSDKWDETLYCCDGMDQVLFFLLTFVLCYMVLVRFPVIHWQFWLYILCW